jgi:hypothetical protein
MRRKRVTAITVLIISLLFPSQALASNEARCPKWEPLIKKYGLPVKTFSYIAWRESRCIPRAVGWNYKSGRSHKNCRHAPFREYRKCSAVRSFDSGLMQINSTWYTLTKQICGETPQQGALFNIDCNMKVTVWLYTEGGGLSHWGIR